MSYIPDIPGINIEDVMDPMLSPDVEEAESRLSEEERKVLAEIRAEKELVLEKIKELQRNIADIDSELECLSEVTSEELMQESRNITKRKRAKTVFKEKPKDGIKILVAEGFVKETPEDIAYYLKTEEMLDKRAIGDYLGEMKEFNIDTLKAFIRLHDFEGRTLVDALR
jgi:Sec7-like guanine-nucleotide exchange factor